MKNIILVVCVFWGFHAIGQSQTRKVLFLGNSYTYTNDLPQLVSQLAASAGDVLLYDSNSAHTLQDHSASSVSQNKILSDDWDYIVLQEQSQRPAFINPAAFMNGFSSLKDFIKLNKPCAQITSFMTWGHANGDSANCPSNPGVCTYQGMQQLLTGRYMEMSDLYESEVTPVGVVWKYIREHHPAINLYQPDGSHPSAAGSYLAACCFYTSLFRKNPALLTDDYLPDAPTASVIRNAVKALVYDQLLNWYIGRYVPGSHFNYTIGNGQNEVLMNGNSLLYKDSFIWDFGDGTTSTVMNPSHSYTVDGSYTVTLTSYKCYLGQDIEAVFQRTVNFCSHTNTVFPNLILCENETGTLWTQPAAGYQWYDELGNAIAGATGQSLEVSEGGQYSVETNNNGCWEMSVPQYVDVWVDNPDCGLGIIDIDRPEMTLFPNPARDALNIRVQGNLKQIAVYDLLANKISVRRLSPNAIDVSGLARGIYIVKVLTAGDETLIARFIRE